MTPSGIFRAIDAGTKLVVLVLVGLVFMVIGFGGAIYLAEAATQAKTAIPRLAYASAVLGVFGALLLPGILGPAVIVSKQVIVLVQQIPVFGAMFGGRRSSDPPAPKP